MMKVVCRARHGRAGMLVLSIGLLLGLNLNTRGAVAFSLSPASSSNLYSGAITLQITGLTNGETVVVEKYLDANTNRIIDTTDWLVQSLRLTDGQNMVIAGVTNFNVPSDSNSTNGSITAQVSLPGGGFSQQIAGTYAYKLSSPSGRFTPITNFFTVTNLAYPQSFTGTVKSSGTNVPYAAVLLFTPPTPNGGMNPVAGTVATSLGSYTLKAPAGTYLIWAVRSNYVADLSSAPVLMLGAGATITTNLTLSPATRSISGHLVDAANNSIGIPGISLFFQSTNNLIASGFTDSNGNFAIATTANLWKVGGDSNPLDLHAYLGLQDEPSVNTTTGNVSAVSIALPKGTALVYGTVKDDQNHPLAALKLNGDQDNGSGPYRGNALTDPNGNYVMAVISGNWSLSVSSDSSGAANYVFSQNPNTNVSDGMAVPMNFTGILATNRISGYVRDNIGNPITNVGVFASASLNGLGFNQYSQTDTSGNYSFNVPNGEWNVGVNCGGGNNSLNQLGYLCVNNQTVAISNNNGTANFIAPLVSAHIAGYVHDAGGNPVINVGVYAHDSSGTYSDANGSTDGSGNYTLGVANGTWNVGVSCFGENGSLSQLGFLCVNEQTLSVTNATGTANFTVLAAPYQISGYLRDTGARPITNVNVNANATISGTMYYVNGQTDANGFYSFNVANGTWNVNVDCNALSQLGFLCANSQSVNISNNNGVANFIAPAAPYQIAGYLSDTTAHPITNIAIYANANINGTNYNANGTTDTAGHYVLHVINGTWNIGVSCTGFNSLNQAGYLCVSSQTVGISNNNGIANFTAPLAAFRITGLVRDTSSRPVTNLNVFASSGPYNANSTTDNNGFYSLNVANGSWDLNLDCNGLTLLGYACASDQVTNINNANAVLNFTVQFSLTNSRPILTAPVWLGSGQFQFTFNTVTGATYTVQYSTNLPTWFSWITLGGTGAPLTITDPSATTAARFYRVKVGP